MALAKRFLRTKQMLILLTSCVFFFGTVWFGSHPDIHPVSVQHHKYHTKQKVTRGPHKDFAYSRDILAKLGFDDLFSIRENSLEETSMAEFQTEQWDLELPSWANTSNPALVTALFVSKSDYKQELILIASALRAAPDCHLLIFDMRKVRPKKEFTYDDRVETYCNVTRVCSVQKVPIGSLPNYISNKDVGAYKPILIQKSLMRFKTAMWVDSDQIIAPDSLSYVWKHLSKHNMATYQLENNCATVSYTYKAMLPYFDLSQNDLYFSHMIKSGSFAFHQSDMTESVLKLWLNCSLTEECIKPTGADPRDCQYGSSCENFQPRFTYIRCHKYETSALSASLVKLKLLEWSHLEDVYPLSYGEESNYNMTAINNEISAERNKRKKSSRRLVNRIT